jgi:hypothetical protein
LLISNPDKWVAKYTPIFEATSIRNKLFGESDDLADIALGFNLGDDTRITFGKDDDKIFGGITIRF